MSIGDRIEGAASSSALALLRLMGPAASSNLAGAVAAAIGPLLPPSRVAHANLRAAMPELDRSARQRIVTGVWRELGRTVGELPHLGSLQENTPHGPGWEIAGIETIEALYKTGGPAIFVSAHMGNWEVLPRAALRHGVPLAGLYRAAKNAQVDRLIARLRRDALSIPGEPGAAMMPATMMFPKGAAGARKAIAHLSRGGFLALLIDQKLNDGIEARFFGLPAMTAPAAATFALHFGCPVIPVLSQRIGPARLRLTVEPPLALPQAASRALAVQQLTQTMNDVVERWIRADPQAWLWLHRRWPYEVVPEAGARAK